MAKSHNPKLIQVQKPAPSLDHFQKNLSKEEPAQVFKKILWAGAVLVGLLLASHFIRQSREKEVLAFQARLSALRVEALGTDFDPKKGDSLAQSIAHVLPQLESSLTSVPSSQRNGLINMINTWRLVLGQPALSETPQSLEAWEHIQLANQQLLMGRSQEARASLQPLASKASQSSSWVQVYWEMQLLIDQAEQNVVSAREHFNHYRKVFPAGDETLKKLRRSVL